MVKVLFSPFPLTSPVIPDGQPMLQVPCEYFQREIKYFQMHIIFSSLFLHKYSATHTSCTYKCLEEDTIPLHNELPNFFMLARYHIVCMYHVNTNTPLIRRI